VIFLDSKLFVDNKILGAGCFHLSEFLKNHQMLKVLDLECKKFSSLII
jgi:uncharacterized membrane protein